MKTYLIITVLFFSCLINGQDNKLLYLIPAPQKVEMTVGSFTFSRKTTISLGNPESEDDLFAAGQIIELLNLELGFEPKITGGRKNNFIRMGLLGKDKAIDLLLAQDKIINPQIPDDEGYILHITPTKILIAAKTSAGLFYGAQTLKQIIKSNRTGNSVPCMTIYDWPALRYRGWMDDISRGPIPTMDFLKNVIKTMAEYKQNYFTLYTEHTFKLKSFPDASPKDGISPEEIAELTGFARKYHVEVIGNAQSFGHMEKILGIPFYKKLQDNPYILNPADENTYKFLAAIYSEIAPAYKCTLFNINCDETEGLGEGGSKKLVDSIGLDGVYAYHINRIDKILKKYNKRLMMWGDIAVNNKGIIDKLPKDLVILSWGYHAAESFDDAILPFKNSGFEFMVAPGVSCWSEIWPNMNNAVINISNYVRDGYKLGAMGMMNTAWDDDGENLFNYNWHGLLWGAECSWKPASGRSGDEAVKERNEKIKNFNYSFDKIFFGCKNLSAANILSGFDEMRKLPIKDFVRDGAFWSDMLDLYPGNVDDIALENNLKAVELANRLIENISQLENDVTANKYLIKHALFAARRVLFTAEKNLVRIEIANQLKTRAEFSKDRLKSSLSKLMDDLYTLKKEYIGLWEQENRGWWLDKVLDKYNRLGNQILNLDKTVFVSSPETNGDKQLISLNTLFDDKDIYYTLNGIAPSVRSEKYSIPIELSASTLIRARVIENRESYPVVEKYFLIHKALGKLYKLNSQYSKYNHAYSAGGDNGLVDGLTGSENFADGRWQGFQGQDLSLILDFGKLVDINKFNISCLQKSYSWILLPKKVQIFTSNDAENYVLLKEIDNPIDPKDEGTIIHNFTADFKNVSSRYLKIICSYPGDLPSWHHAKGNQSFIFADEIVVE